MDATYIDIEKKRKLAQLIGSMYFLILGVVNFIATLLFAAIYPIDIVILILCYLPIIINNNLFLAIFGGIGILVAFVIGFACLAFNFDPSNSTSQFSLFGGYLLSASLFFASFLLIYADQTIIKKPL